MVRAETDVLRHSAVTTYASLVLWLAQNDIFWQGQNVISLSVESESYKLNSGNDFTKEKIQIDIADFRM